MVPPSRQQTSFSRLGSRTYSRAHSPELSRTRPAAAAAATPELHPQPPTQDPTISQVKGPPSEGEAAARGAVTTPKSPSTRPRLSDSEWGSSSLPRAPGPIRSRDPTAPRLLREESSYCYRRLPRPPNPELETSTSYIRPRPRKLHRGVTKTSPLFLFRPLNPAFPDSGKNREEKAEASGAPPDKYCGQPRPPTSLPPCGKMAAPGSRHADFRLVLRLRAGCEPRRS